MRDRVWVRLALVLATAAVLQVGLLGSIRVAGVSPDALMMVAIAGGLVAGERRGALTGFAAGVTLDLLMSARPLGLAALSFTVVGFVAGRYRRSARADSMSATLALAGAVTVLGVGLYGVMAQLFGQGDVYGGRFIVTALVAALWSAALIVPARAVVAWAWMRPVQARSWVK